VNHDGLPDIIEQTFPFTIQGFQVPTFQSSTRPSRWNVSGRCHVLPGSLVSPTRFGLQVRRWNFRTLARRLQRGWKTLTSPSRKFGAGFNQLRLQCAIYMQFCLGTATAPSHQTTPFKFWQNLSANRGSRSKRRRPCRPDEIDPWPSSYNVLFSVPGSAIQARLVGRPCHRK